MKNTFFETSCNFFSFKESEALLKQIGIAKLVLIEFKTVVISETNFSCAKNAV